MKTNHNYLQRTLFMLAGNLLIGLAVTTYRLSGLGVDAFTGMNLGISGFLHLTFGTWQLLINAVLLVIVFFTNRSLIVLFESCASGGARFDPGLLYYAPQGWASDDSDAVERLKIQYGTSMCYPISSIGSHVSVSPNHQVIRNTPLHTRANVAYFGTFGYELDLNKLSDEELADVKEQITFMKKYRDILQFGTFYRLKSPFEGNETVWMVVSNDKKTALVGWYRVLNGVNMPFTRVCLQGLDPDMIYENVLSHTEHYGDELMNLGLLTTDETSGEVNPDAAPCTDFESRIYVLKAKEL